MKGADTALGRTVHVACLERPVLVRDPDGRDPMFRAAGEAVLIGHGHNNGVPWLAVVTLPGGRCRSVPLNWITEQPGRVASILPFPCRGRFATVQS